MNHAFAAAIAPCDEFDADAVKRAIRVLGQDPEEELRCVYCDAPAETWDHVLATVRDSVFSGAGHRIGNLLPCCKPCNSKKGNRAWDDFITAREEASPARDARIARIRQYLEEFFVVDSIPNALPEYARLIEIKEKVLCLMKEADDVATEIRKKMREANKAIQPMPTPATAPAGEEPRQP